MEDNVTDTWRVLWSGVKVSGWMPAAMLIIVCAVPIARSCLSENRSALKPCSIFDAGDAGPLCAQNIIMRGGGLP